MSPVRLTALLLMSVAAVAVDARQAAPAMPPLLAAARQLLVVTTPGWDVVSGELRRYQRTSATAAWQPIGGPVTIVVGRSGTAWDPAMTQTIPGPVKREGDGRSPAGVFALGTAFGLAAPAETGFLKLPYLQETPTLECVDDVRSRHYNRLVDRRTATPVDWTSSEKMAEVGEAYRWGVVVEYNTASPTPGAGSCIFLHISPTPGKGTAGCTAMGAPALDEVMRWLDPAERPVLVQMPAAALTPLAATWQLPAPATSR
jgi:L,D-peptidoglycan transpeptidase YkuD (ErfK/YbiS/YcfS/YnhG family)